MIYFMVIINVTGKMKNKHYFNKLKDLLQKMLP